MTLAYDAISRLEIASPKRNKQRQRGWEGLFPYYAGYPEEFARVLLRSAHLDRGSTVLDPWNGSGTTIAAASSLGLHAHGYDLNPVMVVVARARMLPATEADCLRPLAAAIVQGLRDQAVSTTEEDPLHKWFSPEAATTIRALEEGLRRTVVGDHTLSPRGVRLDCLSGTAAILYVALFNACRSLAISFRSSNPTWTRTARTDSEKVNPSLLQILRRFNESVRAMAASLTQRKSALRGTSFDQSWTISVGDATSLPASPPLADFILSSPPYCTRIDYTSATRIELAILHPLIKLDTRALARAMTGSTLTPQHDVAVSSRWGPTCGTFLERVKNHMSKASSTYYYRTHVDYFDKMSRSLKSVASRLKPRGICVLVVQDSHYKDVHNDLPTIVSEMSSFSGLHLWRRADFESQRSMSRINPGAKVYRRSVAETESVLCFLKQE